MSQEIDFFSVLADIDRQMERIGWNKERAIRHLQERYGKRSRYTLDDQQLLEFRAFLANYQPESKPSVSHSKGKRLKLGSLKLKK